MGCLLRVWGERLLETGGLRAPQIIPWHLQEARCWGIKMNRTGSAVKVEDLHIPQDLLCAGSRIWIRVLSLREQLATSGDFFGVTMGAGGGRCGYYWCLVGTGLLRHTRQPPQQRVTYP